jgi:hypothetical protein
MSFSFHPEAEAEFLKAIEFYEECDPGLGLDFARQVQASIRNAIDFPTMWPKIDDDIRRCLVHRFPYGVLYTPDSDATFVLAVMHLHREPGYWRYRRGKDERQITDETS